MAGHDRLPQIVAYYQDRFDEGGRLDGAADGVLELIRTRELLRARLPAPPAAVLDVGGGPGTHARWLAEDGYRVHLVDPVARHVRQAPVTAGCTAELGDARRLTAADDSYDVVLLLGPLYHLPERADRLRALREALRVVRPGGLVAAAAISRYAPLLDNAATGALADPAVHGTLNSSLADGRYDGDRGFTAAYFHLPDDLARELSEAGLAEIAVRGVEGPSWPALVAAEQRSGTREPQDSAFLRAALDAARLADAHPPLLGTSAHLLGFGRRPAAPGAAPADPTHATGPATPPRAGRSRGATRTPRARPVSGARSASSG
ncbi:class I SAM-dependent methyltransferase [Streptomyces sp. SM14]|uniref:class I SAM-dependent methyltransferase n=2 Tax=unclassified Streptomyces TaxID=2593676 RepID=UPI000CD5524E|nr:class I SAM-dependent methyltransferase [Streptomyces sp. SM14]